MIQLDWDDDQQTIIRYRFLHPWTWAEYYATDAQRDEMFNTSDQIIDIILDFSEGKHIPDEAMTHLPKVASWDSPKRGVIIVIGVNRMLQTLANIMISVYPQAATKAPRPAKDLEDARRMIEEIRRRRQKDHSTT
jgi:hypothetical protein